MGNSLISSILEVDAVKVLQVDFSQLKKIPKETAEKIQTLIYYKDPDNTLYLLTTNNYTEGVRNVLQQLENAGFKTKVFYTSVEGFNEALTWYQRLAEQESQQQQAQKQQQEAA